MAGYDPKQKRAHSPAAADEKAPVDDLLGPPPTPVDDPDAAPTTTGPEVAEPATPLEAPAAAEVTEPAEPMAPVAAPPRPVTVPAPAPPAATGPDPKVLGLIAAAIAAFLFWRWRRR